MKNFAQFNIMIVDFIRIVIIFIKYNTFYFTYPPRKHDFSHILPSCLLFIAESGKYHPVVVLLHNHEWLKKISKKVSSSLETVQCILSSILCPSIFREIWRHCNGAPLLCPINATSSSSYVFRLQYPEVIHCRIVPIQKFKRLLVFERNKGEFSFCPIRAFVYLLALSQSERVHCYYFRFRRVFQHENYGCK